MSLADSPGWRIAVGAARSLLGIAEQLAGHLTEQEPRPPGLCAPEFVAHVFVAADGPRVVEDHRYLLDLWQRCVTTLRIDRPIGTFPVDPPRPLLAAAGDVVLAAGSGAASGLHQAVLRRLGDVLCLSVLRAPPPVDGVRWAALDAEWGAVLGRPTSGVLGSVRILQARLAAAEAPLDPAALAAVVAEHSDIERDRWTDGVVVAQPPWGPFAVWEAADGVAGQPARDERSGRRFTVVAPHDNDRLLSAWTWSNGTDLPPFARYLRQAATVRYELRVRNAAPLRQTRETARATLARLDPVVDLGRVVAPDSVAGAVEALAAARTAGVQLVRMASALRELRATVCGVAAAMANHAGVDASAGPFREDQRVARQLVARAEGDLQRLDATAELVRSTVDAVAALLPAAGSRARVEPAGVAVRGPDDTPGLHRVVTISAGFQNPDDIIEGLRSTRKVCRVEVVASASRGLGTGFLVGPDLVLTCHHVLQRVIAGELRPTGVRFEFGYEVLHDGTAAPTESYELAPDWLVAASPPAAGEEDNSRTALPPPDQLDYAVVRLAGRPGGAMPGRRPLGWMPLRSSVAVPEPGTPLWIPQHPDGNPLKVAVDSVGVRTVNANRTRLAHGVNTLRGSSGAPCLTFDFELVAVHQGEEGAGGNRAVPVSAIVRHLVDSGRAAILDVEPDRGTE